MYINLVYVLAEQHTCERAYTKIYEASAAVAARLSRRRARVRRKRAIGTRSNRGS
jgi:hypothetical protein